MAEDDPTDLPLEELVASAVEEPVSAERVHQLLLLGLARMERKQAALNSDFNGLYQTILQLQRDVNFFTRRCEERGNLIREFIAQVQTDDGIDKDAALEFLRQMECAGTPRPPALKRASCCWLRPRPVRVR
jgi:hypothetical protein